jgi:phosphatidylethanolamine/phosphatidyl-N-methylethanolamine N-methyltransferase
MQDLGFALERFFANPRRFGAVAPSSKALGRFITSNIHSGIGPIIEVGPGTGVFTQALLDRQIPEEDLILVESDPLLVNRLSRQFPAAKVLCRDAETELPENLFLEHKAAAVVSGLPLRNFPKAKVANILASLFAVMSRSAVLYQFTYGRRCPVSRDILETHGIEATYQGRVWCNFPPAAVFRFTRMHPAKAIAA